MMNRMKHKTILLVTLAIVLMLFVGCTRPATTNDVQGDSLAQENSGAQEGSAGTYDDSSETMSEKGMQDGASTEVTIQIVGNKIAPDEVTVANNKKTTISVHNVGDETARFEIPLYNSQINIDVEAGQYEVITVEPTYEGITAIELNGIQVGRVVVE